jgi:hypothetical protein
MYNNLATTPEVKASYIKPISSDEYKMQSSEFTKKALLELKEQMKTFKPKKNSIIEKNIDIVNKNDYIIESNSDTDYNLSDNDNDDDNDDKNTNINVIIRNVKNTKDDNKKKKMSKTNSESNASNASNVTDAIYNKLDNDCKTILQLNNKIVELNRVCNKMDKDLHYLKLDLINFQCDNDKLHKEEVFYKQKIEYLDDIVKCSYEKQIKGEKYFKYLKIFVIVLFCANAYFEYIKYAMLIASVVLLIF